MAQYDESWLIDENNLRIFCWDGSNWVDVTVSVDTLNNTFTVRTSLTIGCLAELVNIVPTVTVPTATGTGIAGFAPTSGTIANLTAVPESALPVQGKPDISFPHGLFEFEITGLTPGQSVTLILTLPSAVPVGATYWKYGPTLTAPLGEWYQVFMGDNDGDNMISITLTDGGLGDDDLTANGTIVDQGGPGWPGPSGGGSGHSAPVFPNIYIGIGAALGAGVVAYLLSRRFARQ